MWSWLKSWIFGAETPQQPPKPPPPPPPPPKTLEDESWRPYIEWEPEFERGLKDEIRELKPQQPPNLLMIGPVGQGKSSFINSVISVGLGRRYPMASSHRTDGTGSWTTEFDVFTRAELFRNYNLIDSMGLVSSDGRGIHLDDIVSLLRGNIESGYTFNPVSPITEDSRYYRRNPVLSDQCHCVIFVMSAKAISDGIDEAYGNTIRRIQEKIKQQHVPQVIILTMVDILCDEVEKNITNLFRSVKVRKTVKKASELIGIDQASINPVKNYETDNNVETMTNIPILIALRQAMQYAEDRIEYILNRENRAQKNMSEEREHN